MSNTTSGQLPAGRRLFGVLVAGDVLALVLWVVIGLASHHMSANWFQNVVRIAAPFLIGWAVASWLTRAYDLTLIRRPAAFMRRTVICWLLAVSFGLALRATLFGSGFVPIFAAVTVAVTAVLILGWRSAFLWWARSGAAGKARTEPAP